MFRKKKKERKEKVMLCFLCFVHSLTPAFNCFGRVYIRVYPWYPSF